uniref:non-specific serine/threonine protein kinase n=1 Tax=Wollemia nobilis TaxID=56998 RepID=A0A0C9RKC8_9CONI
MMHLLLLFSLFLPAIVAHTDVLGNDTAFVYNGFNNTAAPLLVGAASVRSGAVHVTNHSERLIGRTYYPQRVAVKRNGSVTSFHTSFVFAIVPHPRNGGGDGLCFVMTPDTELHGAIATQYLGLVNTTSDGQSYNHIFAVEFDTIQSIGVEDKDSNHVGIDLNSVKSVQATPAGSWEGNNTFRELSLKSGHNIRAWIDYDAASKRLDITLAEPRAPRKPEKPLLTRKNLDLDSILEDEMYVGFSASTGSSPLVEDHYVLAWSFAAGGASLPPLDVSLLPSFYQKQNKFTRSATFVGVVVAAVLILLVGLGLATFWWLKRMDFIDIPEKWELEYWPHRFSYRRLRVATKGFGDERLLGCGGFGRVYRGVLPSSGEEIAVKSITKDCSEGMREFISELSSLGRLQHRNLVPLRGWCRKGKRLFIVYDYMPNGSLDKALPGLGWEQRYRVLKGVAAGLLYLHEMWEKRVVHRDIKSSNVLLDAELDGRVGDFGLARLYDHSEKPQTTHVVGTLGYIAPELVHSGKASPATDVFGFGALMLEVACGRKPVDPEEGAERAVLVRWVWELYSQGRLLEAVDPRLGDAYDAREAEAVLKLGLVCSHPEPHGRPSVRQVLQVLLGEAALPADLVVPLVFGDFNIDVDVDDGRFSAASLPSLEISR